MPNPQLGYGKPSEATIDQVNVWMRSTPWYQNLLKQWGVNPANAKLSDYQRQQILRAAQAQGVVVDEGNMEVDPSGNFNPKGKKLRNTLIVAGIAGAAIATMGAAGVFSGAGAGAASASSTAAAGTGAAAAGGTAAASGAGTAGTIAGGAAAAGGLSRYSDFLRYGLPVAGNLVGGIIAANAEGKASNAQQRYLEEALAYEKEKDAYDRSRTARLDALEVSRYGDYQGRIAPFIANGVSSNDRMAALLGLPARSGGSSSGGPSGDPKTYADRLSAPDKLKVDALLRASNSSDDPEYWYGVNAMHGGFDATGADWNRQRISTGEGVGKGYKGPGAPIAAQPSTSASAASAGTVQMRAPDGSVKAVPASQVPFYTQRGATVLQGAA